MFLVCFFRYLIDLQFTFAGCCRTQLRISSSRLKKIIFAVLNRIIRPFCYHRHTLATRFSKPRRKACCCYTCVCVCNKFEILAMQSFTMCIHLFFLREPKAFFSFVANNRWVCNSKMYLQKSRDLKTFRFCFKNQSLVTSLHTHFVFDQFIIF